MTSERAFFEQLAINLDYWTDTAVESLSDLSSDLRWAENPGAFRSVAGRLNTPEAEKELRIALREILRGQIHSILVAIDGGSAMAETTQLTVTDQDGHELPEGLHEYFIEYLAQTDRL
jgi:hypothetical protein